MKKHNLLEKSIAMFLVTAAGGFVNFQVVTVKPPTQTLFNQESSFSFEEHLQYLQKSYVFTPECIHTYRGV